MKYLDVEIRLPDRLLHPMAAFVRETEAVEYEEMLAWNVQPSRGIRQVLFYVEAAVERYRERVATVEPVQSFRIEPVDESSLHVWAREEIRPEDEAWQSAFAGRQLVVVPPVQFDADAAMRMTVVGDGEDMGAVLDGLPASVGVTVHEIGSYDRRGGTVAGALTDRQREAVVTARAVGYYDVPREATLEDVAAALECAESTASVLLRRAERDVFARVLDRYGGRAGTEPD